MLDIQYRAEQGQERRKGREEGRPLFGEGVPYRAGTRLRRPQIPATDPVPVFETSESQELARDSHILSTGRTEWGKA